MSELTKEKMMKAWEKIKDEQYTDTKTVFFPPCKIEEGKEFFKKEKFEKLETELIKEENK